MVLTPLVAPTFYAAIARTVSCHQRRSNSIKDGQTHLPFGQAVKKAGDFGGHQPENNQMKIKKAVAYAFDLFRANVGPL